MIQRFNPTTGQWDWPAINDDPNGFGTTFAGGVAADIDGYVWAAMGLSGGGINRINTHDLSDVTFVNTGGTEHGVAPDADGYIWGIDFTGTTASIEVSMYSDDAVSLPIVFSFGAAHTCPGWLE